MGGGCRFARSPRPDPSVAALPRDDSTASGRGTRSGSLRAQGVRRDVLRMTAGGAPPPPSLRATPQAGPRNPDGSDGFASSAPLLAMTESWRCDRLVATPPAPLPARTRGRVGLADDTTGCPEAGGRRGPPTTGWTSAGRPALDDSRPAAGRYLSATRDLTPALTRRSSSTAFWTWNARSRPVSAMSRRRSSSVRENGSRSAVP